MQPGPYGNIKTMIKFCGQQRRIDTGSGKRENRSSDRTDQPDRGSSPGNISQCLFRQIEQAMPMLIESRKTPFAYKLDSGVQSGDTGEIVSTGFKTVRHDLRLFFSGRVAAGSS